jgi:hypothetical protein
MNLLIRYKYCVSGHYPLPCLYLIFLTFLMFVLTLADVVCVVLGLYTLAYVGAGIGRYGLTLSIGPN